MPAPHAESEVLAIEHCALRAWPAETVEDLDGWSLRAMHGVTRRANSVWVGPARGALSDEARVLRAEGFYAARGQPPVFQLSPVSAPHDIDARLAARGYAIDAPVAVETADAAHLARFASPHEVQVTRTPSDAWFELSGRQGRFAAVQPVYRGLLERLGDRALYALARVGDQPAAVGLGVCDGAWCGVFSMLTLAPHRRAGLARAVVAALARSAQSRGAQRVYLQVERENAPARALYRGAGFVECYGYHYRVGPAAGHAGAR